MEYIGPILTGLAAIIACLYSAFSKLSKDRRVRIEAQRKAEMENLVLELENKHLTAEIERLKTTIMRRGDERRR